MPWAAVDGSRLKWEGCSAGKSQQQSRKPETQPQSHAGARSDAAVHGANARQHPWAPQACGQSDSSPRQRGRRRRLRHAVGEDTAHTMSVPPASQGHFIFLCKPNAALLSSRKRRSYITETYKCTELIKRS